MSKTVTITPGKPESAANLKYAGTEQFDPDRKVDYLNEKGA